MPSSKWICIDEEGKVVSCPAGQSAKNAPRKAIQIHFINIGPYVKGGNYDGESILIRTNVASEKEKNLLYDAGTQYAGAYVLQYLDEVGVSKIDAMVASHPHYDHTSGFIPIFDAIKKGDLRAGLVYDNGYARDDTDFYPYYSALLNELRDSSKIKYRIVTSKSTIEGLSDVHTKFVVFVDKHYKPGEDAPGLIYKSVLLKITFKESTFVLIGDTRGVQKGSRKKSEDRIIKQYGAMLRSDVLKASEHGSNNGNTDKLLDKVKPGIVGISAKEEGHHSAASSQGAIVRFEARNIKWFSTGRDKTFIIRTNGNRGDDGTVKYHVQFGLHSP